MRRLTMAVALLLAMGASLSPAPARAQDDAWKQYERAGTDAYNKGNYLKAGDGFIKAVDEATRQFGPEDSRVEVSLNNLGEVYRVQGRYAEARPVHLKSQAIVAKLGIDRFDMAEFGHWKPNLSEAGAGNVVHDGDAQPSCGRSIDQPPGVEDRLPLASVLF